MGPKRCTQKDFKTQLRTNVSKFQALFGSLSHLQHARHHIDVIVVVAFVVVHGARVGNHQVLPDVPAPEQSGQFRRPVPSHARALLRGG